MTDKKKRPPAHLNPADEAHEIDDLDEGQPSAAKADREHQEQRTFDHKDMALRGRIGGTVTASRHSGAEMTQAATRGFHARFERQARQEAAERSETNLSEAEIMRRAEALFRAHMARLNLARHKKRLPQPPGAAQPPRTAYTAHKEAEQSKHSKHSQQTEERQADDDPKE